MKALLYHARQYRTKVVSLSNRPKTVSPEVVAKTDLNQSDCIAAFVTVEANDDIATSSRTIAKAITDFAKETGVSSAVIVPFAHLSSSIATSDDAKQGLCMITELALKELPIVVKDHFGSNKELLLDIYGHTGAVRFREA